jgi:tetratricopeptide (TPR) repeat protein
MRPHAAESAHVESDTNSFKRCEQALENLLTSRGNAADDLDGLLADDPEFIPGHVLRAGLIVRADNFAARPKFLASVGAIEALCPDVNDPVRRHAAAARAWLDGDEPLALAYYGAILIDRPLDILALAVAHALDFRLGQRRMLRDRVTQILPKWHTGIPGYASVLAMCAFGLEENGQYRRAEKMARQALAIDPRHPGAIHVVAHVMEMQGRVREGLEFLRATEPAWAETKGISTHLAWHRALFHLDADEPEAALAVYDTQIAKSAALSELADASALLWRLQLRNVRIGERWRLLADRWEMQALTGVRPFYLTHAMMAFAAAGREASARRILNFLPQVGKSDASASRQEDALMVHLCHALLAFAHGDYASCIERLTRVRHLAHLCGGSLAQCDLVHLTFTEAALRAKRAELARALVAERTAQKPSSRFNRRLQRRLASAARTRIPRHAPHRSAERQRSLDARASNPAAQPFSTGSL